MCVLKSRSSDRTFMVTFFSAFCSSQVLSNNLACTLWSICQTCSSSLSSLSSISSLNRSRFPHCNSLSSWFQLKYLLRTLHKDPFSLLSQLLLQLFPMVILLRRQRHVLLWSWWSIFSWSCRFICSRWHTFHFSTTSHSSARAISLTTLNPLHANPWRARSQIELFLLCQMMAYHYCCLESLSLLWHPQTTSNC